MKILDRIKNEKVEWKKLGDVCEIKRGNRVTKKDLIENGKYPVVSGGIGYMGYINEFNRNENTITIAQYGTAGYVCWQKEKFWANDVCFSIYNDDSVLKKYLYYYLQENQEYLYSVSNRTAIPYSISKDVILSLEIPIPSMELQEEIVRILDTLTEYIDTLKLEREQRTKQYEYYRDYFLSEDYLLKEANKKDLIYTTLGEIGKVSMCKRILKNQTNEKGEIPFYKIGTFGKKADSFISRGLFEEYKSKYSYPKKGEILISASGTIGRTIVFDGNDAYFQDSNIVWISHDENKVLNRYLYYVYSIINWNVTNGGTISRLYNYNLVNIPITLPPIEVQEKIVNMLDKFEKIVNDLKEGLPREIELRQKQYEYYREKLFEF